MNEEETEQLADLVAQEWSVRFSFKLGGKPRQYLLCLDVSAWSANDPRVSSAPSGH
jgi:hypothetical protein